LSMGGAATHRRDAWEPLDQWAEKAERFAHREGAGRE
jgi:hypothetical protein